MQCSVLCIKAGCGFHLVQIVFAKKNQPAEYIVCFVLLLMLPGWLHLDFFLLCSLECPLAGVHLEYSTY